MRWRIDDHGRLIISITRREQRSLQSAQRRDEMGQCEPPFGSDAFMHDLLEPMVTSDEFTWLPEGCTDDLTGAPMLGVLGDDMPGHDEPQDAVRMALAQVG